MWKTGKINISGCDGKRLVCEYWAKVYDKPSEYGIEGGKISKMEIDINGQKVCNYDRGWDMEPKTQAAKQALELMLAKYK